MDREIRVINGGVRLDRFLARNFPGYSRGHLKGLIDRGFVKVGETVRSADFRLNGGEIVSIDWPTGGWVDESIDDRVVFEDRDILILNKPAGLVVHPIGSSWLERPEVALGESEANLAGLLLRQRPEIARAGTPRCGIVHRLDRDTSGVMAVGKTPLAQERLVNAFSVREVEKVYRAIVWGVLKGKMDVEAPIGRGPTGGRVQVSQYGRDSSTRFKNIGSSRHATLVEARPLTGRTHQIRAHLAHIQHPVLGDPEWSRQIAPEMKRVGMPQPPRLMLHAYGLSLLHPRTGKRLRFSAPTPKDFRDYWKLVR